MSLCLTKGMLHPIEDRPVEAVMEDGKE